jgi:asparaginyl-tRNA synthetase
MNLSTRLLYDFTSLVLRHLRLSLEHHHFQEILPAILSERFEPGAHHSIAVMGRRTRPTIAQNPSGLDDPNSQVHVTGSRAYYLPVSHAVEKQISMEHVERVYCITPCVRLLMENEDRSGRHLYTFFQVEVEWRTQSIEEVFTTAESILSHFAKDLRGSLEGRSLLNETTSRHICTLLETPYARLTFLEALKKVRPTGARTDLTSEEETELAKAFERPLWIFDYPEGIRDSLYHRNERDLYDTYDLILPFGSGELATGGLRPESGEEIIRQSKLFGKEMHYGYAQWKDSSNVQSAGFGIGLERLLKFVTVANSVLDLRQYHDNGPNKTICQGS